MAVARSLQDQQPSCTNPLLFASIGASVNPDDGSGDEVEAFFDSDEDGMPEFPPDMEPDYPPMWMGQGSQIDGHGSTMFPAGMPPHPPTPRYAAYGGFWPEPLEDSMPAYPPGPSMMGWMPSGTYTCARPGCNNATYSGDPFCSQLCRGFMEAETISYCSRPGCFNPTFDGNPGYCDISCRDSHIAMGGGAVPGGGPSAGAICVRPGCSAPTFDGKPGHYCSFKCRDAGHPPAMPPAPGGAMPGAGAVCMRPGCGAPTFNGQPGHYCSFQCRDAGPPALSPGAPQAPHAAGVHMCQRCGNQPSFQNKPGGYCTRKCRDASSSGAMALGAPAPATSPKPASFPRCAKYGCPHAADGNHSCCSKVCRKACPKVFKVPTGIRRYAEAHDHFVNKWQPQTWGSSVVFPPDIDTIWEFNMPGQQQSWEARQKQIEMQRGKPRLHAWAGEGNSLRRFHGTRKTCNFNGTPCGDARCCCCRIIAAEKFLLSTAKSSSGTAMFGDGLYFTSQSHTAKGYGLANPAAAPPADLKHFVASGAGNVIFICHVLAGNAETITVPPGGISTTQSMKSPDFNKFDSRVVNKSNGNDELVIWNESQVLPLFLITFKGPGKVAKPVAVLHPLHPPASKAAPAAKGVPCKANCGRSSWNGKPGEYCSKTCRLKSGGGGGGGGAGTKFGTELKPSDQKYTDLVGQFKGKWKNGTMPTIAKVFCVRNDALEAKHSAYCTKKIGNVGAHGSGKDPGNQQRRFHQTHFACSFAGSMCTNSSCAGCAIMKTGFSMAKASSGSLFGQGLYSTATSSKAYGYGNQKAMFIVNVACGKAELSSGSGSLPTGYHSRIVNNSNDECIVMDDAAMVPRYLLVFQ